MQKITANIATFPKRQNQLKKMLPSIIEQFDKIRICLNGYNEAPQFLKHDKIEVFIPKRDLKDNGKFSFVTMAEKDEIYCTLDDDINYPKDYAKTIIESLEKYPDSVVTFHGRILSGKHKEYYKAPHKTFRCFGEVKKDTKIDVAGTGVSAFKVFEGLEDIAHSSYVKMSDILFSLNCSFKGKKIMCIKHKAGWIKHIESNVGIYEDMKDNDYVQSVLCSKIFELNVKS